MGLDLCEEHGLKLLLREGSELVDSLFVGMGGVSVVFFDRFEVLLKDTKTIFNLFGRQIDHVTVFDPPFLKQFGNSLLLLSSVEKEEGGEGKGEEKHSKLVHNYMKRI